jgi:hypothetical protein
LAVRGLLLDEANLLEFAQILIRNQRIQQLDFDFPGIKSTKLIVDFLRPFVDKNIRFDLKIQKSWIFNTKKDQSIERVKQLAQELRQIIPNQ